MTHLTRRSILSLAALGAATATLAACSGGAATGGAAAAAYTAPAKDISATLTYAIWDAAQKPAMQKIVDLFNVQYPNIKVNIDVTPSKGSAYWTKIQTLASSDSLPDVFWMNGPKIKLYAENNQLLPLDGLAEAKAVDTSNYPKALVDLYTVGGKLYGVPKDFDTIALFYNKALLREAGVTEPTAAWTWDDLKTSGDKISKFYAGKGVYGFSGDLTGGQTSYYNTILGAGGSIISADGKKSGFDEAGSIAGLQFWRDIIDSGVSPNMQQLTDTLATDMFTSRKLALLMDASYIVGPTHAALGDDMGVVALPKGPTSNQGVIHGLANVIPANAKNPDAARAFVAFLGTKVAAEVQAETATVIPAFNDTQQAWVDAVPGAGLQVFLDAARTASPYPISKNTGAWNSLEGQLLPQAFAGTKPAADIAKDLATKMNEALSQEA
ncbi:multiple sugar transport system substrate-binding protein [Arthrobacter sp. ov407]|uniref:ABC transporter substrate-binding protein n=1 Tax=Arthrobacter sp. ov407 TaxID=1761748 RepID=UPI00088F994B|nr:sugar ABC transporter substrate-binding protein [Arthrobacter sp. ov407]SDL19039.1 multiple sugar transport system substrate-binding protein [Arthrobacter sp. ov407]